jgi:arabinofuranosyltransferase
MDVILIFIPCLIYAYGETKKWIRGILVMAAGFLPFIAWTGFSLFYYGFPFPNTAYAKLNTGITDLDLALQGINYFQNSLSIDPLTLIVIGVSIFSFCLTKKKPSVAASAGIILYLLYIVKIGGDFMSGRFFAVPFFCAVINICAVRPEISKIIWAPVLCFCLFIGLQTPYTPVFSDETYKNRELSYGGIADERGWYYPCTGYLLGLKRKTMPSCGWAWQGRELRNQEPQVITHTNIGLIGFYAGPGVHFIDTLALTDPLLSKLNIINPKYWRIGHFRRHIPEGYINTIETGQNMLADKRLADYYSKLSFIIKGNLFSKERIKEIINMNSGAYDHLLSRYRNALIHIHQDQLEKIKPAGTPWNSPENYLFPQEGIHISLKKTSHAPRIEASLRRNKQYRVLYFKGFIKTGEQDLQSFPFTGTRLTPYIIEVPPDIAQRGYTSLRIIPIQKKGTWSIGHIQFLDTADIPGEKETIVQE